MVRKIRLSLGNSPHTGILVEGCRECIKGAKLVLFITGKCAKSCFYCPISEMRRNQDTIFANEVVVEQPEQAIAEAHMIEATGMGITGGEPLHEVERTLQFIRLFKEEFGSQFHIHLYTGLEPVPLDIVEKLLNAGLDELRLHRFSLGPDIPRLRALTKGRAKLGIEIPVIPGMREQLKDFLRQLEAIGIDFVNLNELEYTALNANELKKRGLQLDLDSIASVQGSEEEALELLEWAAAETSLNLHYCPLTLKDGTQLRNRFRRRAKKVAKSFEEITEEGLIVKGIIKPPPGMSMAETLAMLLKGPNLSKEDFWINESRGQIETSIALVYQLASRLKAQGFQVGVAEEYPIASRFQVSFNPL
ncbi:MAG: radical SAM protein [Promethearchaeota archaeon]